MNITSTQERHEQGEAKQGEALGARPRRLRLLEIRRPLVLAGMLCALATSGLVTVGSAWAQGYGTGAAGTQINPSSIPSSAAPGMAQMGDGGGGGSGIINPGVGTIRPPMRDSYKLGPQDVISVNIERFPAYSTDNIIIPPDGRISLPYFKTIYVNGMTAAQLESRLTGMINRRIRNPMVRVSIRQLRSAAEGYVNVIGGALQTQGAIEILRDTRLTEVLAKVGGVRGAYDEVSAVVSRGKQRIPIDLYRVFAAPTSAANIKLMANDVLTVETVQLGRIRVQGDIVRGGLYLLRRAPVANAPELTLHPKLSELVVAMGGFINNDRLLNGEVTGFIQRGPDRIELRVNDAITFKDASANIELKPNDYVNFTVETPIIVDILGLARVPGNYRIRPGAGVLQAIALAGGLTKDALQTSVNLQRRGVTRDIDLPKLLAGDITQNVALESGDTLSLSTRDTLQVAISGSVAEASKGDGLDLPPGATLSVALARAGGIRSALDRTAITVIRTLPTGEQKFLSIDPVALNERNDPSQNIKLQQGDIINVQEKRQMLAAISGEIAQPGQYPVDDDGVDLATFITGAKGARDTALLSAINIRSANGTVKTVDAYDAVTNGRPLNVQVREGDLISIPENRSRILINGAVRSPGIVPLPERRVLTLQEALAAVGGPVGGARTREIVLVRAKPDGKGGFTPETRTLNLLDVKKGNITDSRLPVQDGDVIVVPEGKARRDPLSTGLTAFSLFNIARSF